MQHSPRFLKLVEEVRPRVREITVADLRARLDKGGRALVFDVREDHEWSEGHIRGAEHLGRGILERDIEKRVPDVSTEIILYCGGGFRSALAADNLQRMGYTNVFSLAGGWRAWTDSDGPIERQRI